MKKLSLFFWILYLNFFFVIFFFLFFLIAINFIYEIILCLVIGKATNYKRKCANPSTMNDKTNTNIRDIARFVPNLCANI